jgi:6-pyruvoyltetrahydropterin/6-carboxytetrahydropterin synthase
MSQPIAYITRRHVFSAAHRLHSLHLSAEENLETFGKCNHPTGHGHNYVLEVTLKGPIDPNTGMIFNLSELKTILTEAIDIDMDHKHLNFDAPEFKNLNPTAENIAYVIWQRLVKQIPQHLLYEVKIWETENNIAIYKGEF